MSPDPQLKDPPREFSLMPFWFWNDALDEAELHRQIEAFDRNGVYGFVIHPRVGLPRDTGWMSEKLLGFYHVAIEAAAGRGMKVLLYDEGMYPSGSSAGQVVARSPELACRCLALHEPDAPLPPTANIVETITLDDGRRMAVIDRPAKSVIRGLHYTDESAGFTPGKDPPEDEPPAGDILNPRTADTVIELVYDRFHKLFGSHFGNTILGVFTDEPNPTGRLREKNVIAGTSGILPHVNRLLGYDFRPHLAALWSKSEEAKRYRDDYRRAIRLRLEETWYAPLSAWCDSKGVALCGHPDAGDEIGVQRHFQIPGQDLVWRWVAPDQPNALQGPEATQGKCTSSAMLHSGRRRNSNEFAGAYGPQTTFEEIRWLANWCLVRGVNLLIPHAFYYTIRGPRKHERPPQIGPHTPQWDADFKPFADACRRLCWVNTDSRPICHTAILTHDDRCPSHAAAALLESRRDFNYLDPVTLLERARVNGPVAGDAGSVTVGPMHYTLLIVDGERPLRDDVRAALRPLLERGNVVRYAGAAIGDGIEALDRDKLIARIDAAGKTPVAVEGPGTSLRVRSLEKNGRLYTLVFNESGRAPATFTVRTDPEKQLFRVDPATGSLEEIQSPAASTLPPGVMGLFVSNRS